MTYTSVHYCPLNFCLNLITFYCSINVNFEIIARVDNSELLKELNEKTNIYCNNK